MNKRIIADGIAAQLRGVRAGIQAHYKSRDQASKEAPGAMQSRYDTSRFEESRVAEATGKRLRDLDEIIRAVEYVSRRPPVEYGAVGSVVHVREEKNELFFLILPPGGGGVCFEDKKSGITYQAVSTESPIGRALLGKSKGDTAVFTVPAGKRTFEILDVG